MKLMNYRLIATVYVLLAAVCARKPIGLGSMTQTEDDVQLIVRAKNPDELFKYGTKCALV